jgi:hypothetical protein
MFLKYKSILLELYDSIVNARSIKDTKEINLSNVNRTALAQYVDQGDGLP